MPSNEWYFLRYSPETPTQASTLYRGFPRLLFPASPTTRRERVELTPNVGFNDGRIRNDINVDASTGHAVGL